MIRRAKRLGLPVRTGRAIFRRSVLFLVRSLEDARKRKARARSQQACLLCSTERTIGRHTRSCLVVLSTPCPLCPSHKMTIRIRLARHGRRNAPFYHLVAIQQRLGRNRKPIELLGTYDPIPRPPWPASKSYPEIDSVSSDAVEWERKTKKIEWSVDRIRYWLRVGAIPSDSALKLLQLVRVAPSSYTHLLTTLCGQSGIPIPANVKLSRGIVHGKTTSPPDWYKERLLGKQPKLPEKISTELAYALQEQRQGSVSSH